MKEREMSGTRLIGYTRASRWAGAAHAEHLDEQRRELERTLGSDLTAIESDRLAGRSLRRPGLHAALAACREGRADGIAVTSLDRLSRSLDDLAELFAEARAGGFRVIALAEELDTATASGALVQRVLAEAGGWGHRSLARERARAAFEPAARGRRGRPVSTPADVADRIRTMRRDGATLQAICDALNAEGVPTPRGGTHWRPTSLRAVLRPATEGGTES
jgi:DNA invertase Pin-like site-specific DNA recombinase